MKHDKEKGKSDLNKKENDRFKCEICEKCLSDKSNLNTHMTTHYGKTKDIECPNCKKKFNTRINLNRHIKDVHGEKKFNCKLCGKKFPTRFNYERHMKCHTKNP